jgi:glycosyltransferase involved in cell wall biosynthesis
MIDDTQTGFLVDVGSVTQITDAVRSLLSSRELLDRMKQAGRQKVRDQFSLGAEVAGIARVYEAVWKGNGN